MTIAQTTIGYAATAEMSARRLAERTEWESLSVTPFDVSLLDGSLEDLHRYAQEMQSSMGAQDLMMPDRSVESAAEIENANEENRRQQCALLSRARRNRLRRNRRLSRRNVEALRHEPPAPLTTRNRNIIFQIIRTMLYPSSHPSIQGSRCPTLSNRPRRPPTCATGRSRREEQRAERRRSGKCGSSGS